jgi:hypothetical protein
MAALSITTVIFSLMGDCPPLAFYVLEVIVNGVMILEVAIRVVAFGKVSPSRPDFISLAISC